MERTSLRSAFVVGIALLAGACASSGGPRAGTTAAGASVSSAISARPGMAPSDYVARAGGIDLFIIRASELAATRAGQLRTREVAQRLIASRKGTSQQLSFAGRRLNLLPSAQLPANLEARLAALTASADFDSAYRREMRAVLDQALQLNRAFSAGGSSPTLRPVAVQAQSQTERDLRLVSYL